jgi:hypothetical protein
MSEYEITIIDGDGVHAGIIDGNTLSRKVKVSDWTPFTHRSHASENWARLYPYTAVAYQFGKRIYPEFADPRDLIEHIEDSTAYSVGIVISPNGKAWTREEFTVQYYKIIGLIVEASNA